MERARNLGQTAASFGKDLLFRRLEQLIRSTDFDLNYEIVGAEHIETARELIASGKILVAALDHRSYADMASGAFVAIKWGFNDLVQKAHIVMKVSYLEHFPTSLLPHYFDVWPVVPHTLSNYPNRDEINRASIEKAESLKGGSIIVITPEGTRSGETPMQEARYGAERFWHGRGERFILPIAIEGTEKQWPRKLGLAAGAFYYAWIGRLVNSRFIFGAPVAVSELDALALELAQGDDANLPKLRTDLVMGEIARLHLVEKRPEYAGKYADLGKFLKKAPITRNA